VNPGSPTAWEIELKPGANTIGRGFANDFKISDPSVSTSHCQIIIDSGNVIIKDLGSTNGTFVNRAPVSEARLQAGQTVHLGGVEMLFQSDAPPRARIVQKPSIAPSELPPPPPPHNRKPAVAPAHTAVAG
jgi:DNA segregation ATPase FtsK/SpoIIIE, S-DNA-T family